MDGGSKTKRKNLRKLMKPLGKRNTIKLLKNMQTGGFIRAGSIQYFTAPCNNINSNKVEH